MKESSERALPNMSTSLDLNVRVRKRLHPDFTLDVQASIPAGITILFGASGSGKTTLLDVISGAKTPDDGHIAIGAAILFDSSSRINTPPWRRKIGYVFQDLALFPHLSAQENVEYGLRHVPAEERRRRSFDILKVFHVEELKGRRPKEISGGERQRVALARALVTQPRSLLLDEPLAALDRATKSGILDDLRAWNRQHRVPIVYVTHSRDEVFALGEQVMVLERGKVIAEGRPHDVMRAPTLETVAALAGFENVFDVTVSSIHNDRGTMTCRLGATDVEIETPMVATDVGSSLRVGFRAGDVLLAIEKPRGLSARNIIAGTVAALERRDVVIAAVVDCGVKIEAHLTLAARDTLGLTFGMKVWLVLKTHSCHLMSL